MKKAIRCITLVLVLCLIFSAAGTVVSADDFVDGSLMVDDYGFQTASHKTLRALFCMDARGFVKALAFESAETQKRVIRELFIDVDPQIRSYVTKQMHSMYHNVNQGIFGTSEQNLLRAMFFWNQYQYGLDSQYTDLEQLLQNAIASISLDWYTNDLGYYLRKDPYSFIVALSKLEQSDQNFIVSQLSPLNGTERSIAIVERLQMLGADRPGTDSPSADSEEVIDGLDAAQTALVHAILECLKDTPPWVDPQEPVPEELASWQQSKTVPRTDFDAIVLQIANNNYTFGYTFPQTVLQDVAGFVQALARLKHPESREKVINQVSAQIVEGSNVRLLLYCVRSYLAYCLTDDAQKNAASDLIYTLLRHNVHAFEAHPDFSSYFAPTPPDGQHLLSSDEAVYQLAIDACWFTRGFVITYVAADQQAQDLVCAVIKQELIPAFRQALIDTVYDAQSEEGYNSVDLAAMEAFLADQAAGLNPMYPYGIDPNTPPATEPTEPPETSAPTEATEPEESEAATQETSGDPDPAKPEKTASRSHLLSTVLLCAAAFALGIPIGVAVVNRKKRNPKQEEDAVPPAQDEEGLI